jgi:hypothetical protein
MTARSGIENVLARFAWAFDLDEFEQIGDCFTANAEVEFDDGLAVGRDAVVANLEQRRAVFRGRQVVPWHVITNLLIREAHPTRVDATCFFTFFTRADGAAPQLSSIGYYEDRFVQEDGMWRIQWRAVVPGGKI